MGPDDGPTGRHGGRLAVAAGCWPNGIKSTGSRTVCDAAQPNVVRSYAFGLWYAVAPVPRVHRAALQMSAMGLWRPPVGPGVPGPMPVSYHNCMKCANCLPEKSG